VDKIAKLLHRPRRRSVIRGYCQEKTDGREMFRSVEGHQVKIKVTGAKNVSVCAVHFICLWIKDNLVGIL